MFLDDEIVDMCKKINIENKDDLQNFYADVCKKCEDYYKSRIDPEMTNKDIKTILDRTFNLWNSAVRICKESNDGKLKLFGDLFSKCSFKDQFLANPEVNRIYQSL